MVVFEQIPKCFRGFELPQPSVGVVASHRRIAEVSTVTCPFLRGHRCHQVFLQKQMPKQEVSVGKVGISRYQLSKDHEYSWIMIYISWFIYHGTSNHPKDPKDHHPRSWGHGLDAIYAPVCASRTFFVAWMACWSLGRSLSPSGSIVFSCF